MRQKEDILDLERKYRKLEQSLESIDLPSSDELRTLLEQHDRDAQQGAPFVPLSRPVRRSLQRPVWRYAASLLLLITMGLVGWFFLRQPSSTDSGMSPVAVTRTDDSTSEDNKCPDSLRPVTPLLDWQREEGLMAFEQSPSEPLQRSQDRPDSETGRSSILSHTRDTAGMLVDNDDDLPKSRCLPVDSSADPHGLSDYPDRKMLKEVDLQKDENSDRRALRENPKKPAKRKRKLQVDKNDKDNRNNDINVIVPEKTAARPHQVPLGNGRFITVYH